jgi:hypothetical protein
MPTAAETVVIEVDRETADMLRAQAGARGISLDAYLRTFMQGGSDSALVEFDRWLDELSDGAPSLPLLAADFSRKDVYDDHD